MALRWENPASTTHSLTPSPSNRPLIFWILTPCKKPGATGSAGRCDLGVGRFTDPHPLTCSFFTPLSTARFSGICYGQRRNFRYLASQLFSSLLCSARFLYPSPYGGGAGSSSTFSSSVFYCRGARCFAPGKDGDIVPEGFSRNELSTHFAHNQLTRLQQGLFGASLVRFRTRLPKPHTGPHGVEFGFTVFSWCVSAPARLPNLAPSCNSPPLG